MEEIVKRYGNAFSGIESLIYSQSSEGDVIRLLRELNEKIDHLLLDTCAENINEIKVFIDDSVSELLETKNNRFKQITEAESLIKEHRTSKNKKFKKIQALKSEIYKIDRLSDSMTLTDIAEHFSIRYREELHKNTLSDFTATDIFNAIKKYKPATQKLPDELENV